MMIEAEVAVTVTGIDWVLFPALMEIEVLPAGPTDVTSPTLLTVTIDELALVKLTATPLRSAPSGSRTET